MYALNNVTTADDYTTDNTLECPGTQELVISVNNAAIYLQYAFRAHGMRGAAPVWAPEVFFIPGPHVRGRNVDRVRVRSAVTETPAQVTIEAVT